jgi:hypothetical protein
MSRGAHMAQLVCLGFVLAACDDGGDPIDGADAGAADAVAPMPDATPDAAPDASNGGVDAQPDAGAPEDTGPDVGPLPSDFGNLFGSCIEDADCEDMGGICRSAEEGFPGWYCTKPCDSPNDRTACEVTRGGFTVYHHCADRGAQPAGQFTCEFNCLNGLDCGRDGYTCAVNALPGGGLCIPVCSSDEECSWGTYCDRYTGECQVDDPPDDPTTIGLSPNGGPCNSDAQCASGDCFEGGTRTQPTGWVGGYCVGNCILPSGFNNNDFFVGDALPPGTCPGENPVCIPRGQAQSRQDLGICLQGCADANDCRQGYECARRVGNKLFDVGFCRPGTCGQGGTVVCPADHTCVTVQSGQGTTNICAPN